MSWTIGGIQSFIFIGVGPRFPQTSARRCYTDTVLETQHTWSGRVQRLVIFINTDDDNDNDGG